MSQDKNIMQITDRIPKHDFVTPVIEIIGRGGRWLLETSMLCIVGYMLFAGLATVVLIAGSFVSIDTQEFARWMPAAGWCIAMAIGLIKAVSDFRKPFGSPIEDSDEEVSDSSSPTVVKSPSAFDRTKGTLKALPISALFGVIIGIGLSVYFCVVATAVILSPFAPQSWKAPMRVEAQDHDELIEAERSRSRRSSESTGASVSTGANFWHPVYGTIVKICLVLATGLLTVLGAVFGWIDPFADD